jgi:hypothetical protein
MKEKKEKCRLCKKFLMTKHYNPKSWVYNDTVHIKGYLFKIYLDEVFHKHCFKKFCSIEEFCG